MLITSSFLLDILIVLVIGVYALHYYISRRFKYWEKRGVYSPETKPIFGNFLDVILLKETSAEWMKRFYDKIKKPFFGIYIFNDPYLVVCDPKLVKNVLIKDFNYFVDRNIAAPDHSRIMKHILFSQKSPEWKNDRSKLTVCFSSGKLKAMFPLLKTSSYNLRDFLVKNQTVHEAKELAAKYSTEVISKCAFGIESHSFKDTNSNFTKFRKRIFDFSMRNAIIQTLYFFKPRWADTLKLKFFETEALEYFMEAFMSASRARAQTNDRCNDFIDIMNDIKKEDEKLKTSNAEYDWTFVGAAFQFFLAGTESTSATISFTLYEYAMKPYIQQRAREEMNSVIEKHGGLTYESLSDMTYLEMCINEILRKYPVVPFIERKCNEDYKIPDTDKVIEKGTPILIPMLGLHMDAKLFPDPHKYDPERFKTKVDTTNGVYFLPFGKGPRNCLGARFGIISTKLALISIIMNFELTPCPKTPDPIEFTPKSFLLQSKVGLPIRFTKLTN